MRGAVIVGVLAALAAAEAVGRVRAAVLIGVMFRPGTVFARSSAAERRAGDVVRRCQDARSRFIWAASVLDAATLERLAADAEAAARRGAR